MQQKRTKIIATLGPASSDFETIKQLILAGTNVFRLNFSHGSAEQHRSLAQWVRQAAREAHTHIALLGDLQGPKIRTHGFAQGPVWLEHNQHFILDCALDSDQGDNKRVGVTYADLAKDCRLGQTLLLDDGRIELQIEKIEGAEIHTRVTNGGKLGANKGINLLGGGLSAPALTEKDYLDIKLATEINVDYLAVSFPRSAADMDVARLAAREAHCHAGLVAKIERAEAVRDDETLDQIILHSDAVMVARGDLGVEIGDAELIALQKKIIMRARQLNRIVITATQMMESMIESSLPTRAEVSDVANAVLDGTDAVMLSAETATGKHPIKVVQAMSRIILGAEKAPATQRSHHRIDREFNRTDEAIAMATMYIANHLNSIKAILCFTETGSTPQWMSRIRSGLPIYAISPYDSTLNRVALIRGVRAIAIDPEEKNWLWALDSVLEQLKKSQALAIGDTVLLTYGEVFGQQGGTNSLKIITLP